jgi:hypothetical protein
MRKTLNFVYVLGMAAGGAVLSAGAAAGPFIKYDGVKGEAAGQQGKPGTADDKADPDAGPQKGLLLPAVQKVRDVSRPPPPPPSSPKGKPQTAVGDINGDGLDGHIPQGIITPRKSGDDKMNSRTQRPSPTMSAPSSPTRPAAARKPTGRGQR